MKKIEAIKKLCPFKLPSGSSDRLKNCEADKCMAWMQQPGKEDEGACGMLIKNETPAG